MSKPVIPGSSTRKTTDMKIPTKKDGTVDKRYNDPQYCKNDGTKDKRTTNTADRK